MMRRVAAEIGLCLVGAAVVGGCYGPAPSTTQNDSPPAAPGLAQFQAESSSVVIPPQRVAACPNGAVVIGTGIQGGSGSAVFASGSVACAAATPTVGAGCYELKPVVFPTTTFAITKDVQSKDPKKPNYNCNQREDTTRLPSYPGGDVDMQVIRIPGSNELLHVKLSGIWSAPAHPIIPAPTNPPPKVPPPSGCNVQLGRLGLFFYVSNDCGANWALQQIWDPNATTPSGLVHSIEGGKYATGTDQYPPYLSGFDRQELYADPFNPGRLYLTAGMNNQSNANLLFRYDPGKPAGERWSTDAPVPVGHRNEPTVMTSTPDGRLFLFHCEGDQPTLYWSDDGGNSLAGNYTVPGYVYQGSALPCGLVDKANLPPEALDRTQPVSLARHTTSANLDSVLVAYPAILSGFQAEAVVLVTMPTIGQPSATPTTLDSTLIAALGDVLDAHFIETDRFEFPLPQSNPLSDAAVLTWLEATVPFTNGGLWTWAARYAVVRNGVQWSAAAPLSVSGGSEATWTFSPGVFTGDYEYGAFFYGGINNAFDRVGLHYFAQWPESEPGTSPNVHLHANIVTVTELAPIQIGLE